MSAGMIGERLVSIFIFKPIIGLSCNQNKDTWSEFADLRNANLGECFALWIH